MSFCQHPDYLRTPARSTSKRHGRKSRNAVLTSEFRRLSRSLALFDDDVFLEAEILSLSFSFSKLCISEPLPLTYSDHHLLVTPSVNHLSCIDCFMLIDDVRESYLLLPYQRITFRCFSCNLRIRRLCSITTTSPFLYATDSSGLFRQNPFVSNFGRNQPSQYCVSCPVGCHYCISSFAPTLNKFSNVGTFALRKLFYSRWLCSLDLSVDQLSLRVIPTMCVDYIDRFCIYAPPHSGKTSFGQFIDTDHSCWCHDFMFLTNRPDVARHAIASIWLIPSDATFQMRCRERGLHPSPHWYSDLGEHGNGVRLVIRSDLYLRPALRCALYLLRLRSFEMYSKANNSLWFMYGFWASVIEHVLDLA